MKLLITDLDNTLYDWMTFFSKAFSAMVDALHNLINVDREVLLDQFKTIHQKYGNTEQPFTILELPAVLDYFGSIPRSEMMKKVNPALHAFNSTRKKYLHLYDTVHDTLAELFHRGVVITGYTEAIGINGYYRLYRLDILQYFKHLYASNGQYPGHPEPALMAAPNPPGGFIRNVPDSEKKPNPELLLDICERENINPGDAFYIGDSLVKDVAMARQAGVKAIWARYGTQFDKKLWEVLVRVTHWTEKDVREAAGLRNQFQDIKPDYTIDQFSDILKLFP